MDFIGKSSAMMAKAALPSPILPLLQLVSSPLWLSSIRLLPRPELCVLEATSFLSSLAFLDPPSSPAGAVCFRVHL
ncbi:unnamed protein product [Victoria cruziana]